MNRRDTSFGFLGMNLVLAIGLAMSGVGCGGGGDGGDASPVAGNVVGAWGLTSESTDGAVVSAQSLDKNEVLIFDADAQWTRVTILGGTTTVEEGLWTASGTTLTLTPKGRPPSTFVYSVNSNNLAIASETIGHTFGFTFDRK